MEKQTSDIKCGQHLRLIWHHSASVLYHVFIIDQFLYSPFYIFLQFVARDFGYLLKPCVSY